MDRLSFRHTADGRPVPAGRASGRRSAVQALFGQMNQRNGHQSALSYLTRFAEEWPEEGVSAGSQFNFKVLMEENK